MFLSMLIGFAVCLYVVGSFNTFYNIDIETTTNGYDFTNGERRHFLTFFIHTFYFLFIWYLYMIKVLNMTKTNTFASGFLIVVLTMVSSILIIQGSSKKVVK